MSTCKFFDRLPEQWQGAFVVGYLILAAIRSLVVIVAVLAIPVIGYGTLFSESIRGFVLGLFGAK